MLKQYYRKYDYEVNHLHFLVDYFRGYEDEFVTVINMLLDEITNDEDWDSPIIKFKENATTKIKFAVDTLNNIFKAGTLMTNKEKLLYVCDFLPDEFIVTQEGNSDRYIVVQLTNYNSRIPFEKIND